MKSWAWEHGPASSQAKRPTILFGQSNQDSISSTCLTWSFFIRIQYYTIAGIVPRHSITVSAWAKCYLNITTHFLIISMLSCDLLPAHCYLWSRCEPVRPRTIWRLRQAGCPACGHNKSGGLQGDAPSSRQCVQENTNGGRWSAKENGWDGAPKEIGE